MKLNYGRLRKLAYGVMATAVFGVALVPALSGRAFAYGLVTTRSIQMSSSAAAATNTSYLVTFTPASATLIQAIAVDFCSNDPIIGDSCTAPTSFSVGTPTVTGTSVSGETGGSWTATAINSNRTLVLSNGSATGSVSGATSFTLTTATNPNNSNTTFYARIFTFSSTANETTWASTANGSATATVLDAGGIALSTDAQITVTSKVQETLTFCVYTGANCGAGGTAVTLGDTNGVLSTAGPFVDLTTKYDIATNAGGASPSAYVRFKATTLTSGGNQIASIGSSATASSTGTSQFGLCTYRSSGSLLAAIAPYDNANCNTVSQTAGTGSTGGNGTAQFALDTTAAATTYGDDLASTSAGSSNTGVVPFIGNVSATQAAGIYTSTFNFIATATY
jgi:hypothetical protein